MEERRTEDSLPSMLEKHERVKRRKKKKKKKKDNRLALYLLSLNINWQDLLKRGKIGAEGGCDE